MTSSFGKLAAGFKNLLGSNKNAAPASDNKKAVEVVSEETLKAHALPFTIPLEHSVGTKVNDTPSVTICEDFLTQAEVFQIIKAAGDKMQRARVSSGKEGIESAGRTGSNCWVAHDHNKVTHALAKRISKLVGISLQNAESFQVIHYGISQEYSSHFDAWEFNTERGERCMARGGQRLVTCLIYLNDVPAGGGTGFPELDLEVQAKKGRMVIFHNCYPGTNYRHPHSLHGGLPVEEGEKWAVNLWFREADYWAGTKKTDAPARKKYGKVM